MAEGDSFPLQFLDYFAFGTYFIVLCAIGLWAGRKEKTGEKCQCKYPSHQ